MNSEWILGPQGPRTTSDHHILDTAGTRTLEELTAPHQPPGALMQRAGLALAKLALAVAPHAHVFWIACGRGNNGGDGLEAALHLHQWGKQVHISMPRGTHALPDDAALALDRTTHVGLTVHPHPPEVWDACVDALLGIGLRDAPSGIYTDWIEHINQAGRPVISADIPSGLLADTGGVPGHCVRADHTLAMLRLKPGLLTLHGRDMCGNIWLNTLDTTLHVEPMAYVNAAPAVTARPHNSHKGNHGDVAVVGGASGMEGAALLAAHAALHAGAGRVYLALLSSHAGNSRICAPADVMQRTCDALDPTACTLVVGCGGGAEIANTLPRWLMESARLVLDADALNAIASNADLRSLLQQRPANSTLITPHPLEAARLLGWSVAEVQADRIAAAQRLATDFQSTVILKGSGSVIAAPQQRPRINPTGNGKLAIAGTGDVLAGMAGTALAHTGNAWLAACEACYRHGALADSWEVDTALTASRLIEFI